MEKIELKGLNECIYVYNCSCGLPIYMWVSDKVNSMYASLSVKYGSIHTKFKVGNKTYKVPNGTAHFLEHVKFNLSDERSAHDEFYKLGGDANAFTTFNYTSYIVYATQNKNENLKLLLDYVYNPYFTKKLVNKEKGIITEEASMTLDDPYMVSFFDSLKNTFQKSNYRNLITGTKEEVNSITKEDVELVYDTFYHPKNMFLTITGNFNPYEVSSLVEEVLSKKEFLEYKGPKVITPSEPRKVTSTYSKESINITSPRIKVNIKIPLNEFKIKDKLLLKTILNLIMSINFGETSTFKEELMENNLIVYMSYNVDFYDSYVIIGINVNTNYIEEIKTRLNEKINNLSISEIDLKRKKNASIATLILDYEDIENVNMKIQDEIVNFSNIVDNYKELLESIDMDLLNEVKSKINADNISVNVFLPNDENI